MLEGECFNYHLISLFMRNPIFDLSRDLSLFFLFKEVARRPGTSRNPNERVDRSALPQSLVSGVASFFCHASQIG
jgi:hypothetical protein